MPLAAWHTQCGHAPGCPLRWLLCWWKGHRVEQSWCNLHSLRKMWWRCCWEVPLCLLSPTSLIQPGSPAVTVCRAQALPGQWWIHHGEQGELCFPPSLCPPAAPWLSWMNRGVVPATGTSRLFPGLPSSVAWHECRGALACMPAQPQQTHLRGSAGWATGAGCTVLSESGCPCPALGPPADRRPLCNVISITILPLGTLTTRRSLIAPVICLAQQAAHPKQGD